MVNLILKLFGFGKAVDALDGESSKAYAGALGQMATGAATLLGGVAGLLSEFSQAHGGSAYLALIQGFKSDPSAGAVLAGAALISMGYTAIGQRHAIAKAASDNDAKAQATTPPPTI